MVFLRKVAFSADRYDANIAVAALDLLAVRKLAALRDQSTAVMNVLAKFVQNATSRGIFKSPTLTDRHANMFAGDTYFGDSLYLFANSEQSLEGQVQWLVVRVATLIGLGLWWEPTFMVRAAIAVGDLRTRTVHSDGPAHEIRIGSSMIRAHVLQECQSWIGGAIYPGTRTNAETRRWLATATVPLKTPGVVNGVPTAINWIWSNANLEDLERYVTSASSQFGLRPDIAKVDNTLAFVRATITGGERAPYQGPERQ